MDGIFTWKTSHGRSRRTSRSSDFDPSNAFQSLSRFSCDKEEVRSPVSDPQFPAIATTFFKLCLTTRTLRSGTRIVSGSLPNHSMPPTLCIWVHQCLTKPTRKTNPSRRTTTLTLETYICKIVIWVSFAIPVQSPLQICNYLKL